MCCERRWGAILTILLVANVAARGESLLLHERVDREEVTEVRCRVPFGRVITGLGFRAHYDNITTMHCRHHRLTGDGRLVEPEEIQLGSEPDHQCEAKVLLPDGWVAVGFGLAGEPEWDVTLLRVWARQLERDGSLGPIKAFSDGFKPDRGPEREFQLQEADRVLCGAGARFGSNDISGIYARSRRVVRVDGDELASAGRMSGRIWVIDGVQGLRPESISRNIGRLRPDRIDLELTGAPEAVMIHAVHALLATCEPHSVGVHVWIGPLDLDKVAGLHERCPDLKGIVLSVPPGTSLEDARVQPLNDLSREARLALSLRFNCIAAGMPDWSSSLPHEVGFVVTADCLEAGMSDQTERSVILEIQPDAHATWRVGLPDLRVHDLAGQIIAGALAGARGFAVRVNTGETYLSGTVNGLSLLVLPKLADSPFQCPEEVRSRACMEQYGDAARFADAAIEQATDANALIFKALGIPFLWDAEGIATIDVASFRLEDRLTRSPQNAEGQRVHQLLSPTQQTVDELRLEAETARWLLLQSRQNALGTIASAPSMDAELLGLAVAKNEAVTSFCNAAKEVFVLARLYGQDVSPSTRDQVESSLARLPQLADATTAAIGSSALCEGLGGFMASVRDFLERADREAPLAVAFTLVRKHADDGRHEDAARALAEILQDPAFIPHLEKNKTRIAHLASSLSSLWSCPENMKILRGADGRWVIARKDGRWAWATTRTFPCVYFDVLTGPLSEPDDFTLSFEYYDEGDFKIWVNYDSDYPGGASERQYRAAEPVQLANTGQWRTATRRLTRCRFGNGQNEGADLRFVGGREKIIHIRNVLLTRD